jgi:hypothetical protein
VQPHQLSDMAAIPGFPSCAVGFDDAFFFFYCGETHPCLASARASHSKFTDQHFLDFWAL